MSISTIKSIILILHFCHNLQSSLVLKQNPYCYLKHEGKPNLLCDLEPCSVIPRRCTGDAEELKFSQAEREHILLRHNEVRQEFNEEKGGWSNFGYALDMKMLKYDVELEFSAQCWANMCIFYGEEEYCRRTKRFNEVGYNKYLKVVDNNYNTSDPKFVEEAITTWKNKSKLKGSPNAQTDLYNLSAKANWTSRTARLWTP